MIKYIIQKISKALPAFKTSDAVDVWEGNDKQRLSQKQFLCVMRMIEAEKVLRNSDFKGYSKNRKAITEDILFRILNEKPIEEESSKKIAKAYLQNLPIFSALKTYDLDDLALAITNHYHPTLLPAQIYHLSGMTSREVVKVCRAILDDFDPSAARMQGRAGQLGEFKKYVANAPYNHPKHNATAIYFNAIETHRAYQYQSLYGVRWVNTARYKALYEQTLPPVVETPKIDVSGPSVDESRPTVTPAQEPAETGVNDTGIVIGDHWHPADDEASPEIPDDSELVDVRDYDDNQGVDVGYEDDSGYIPDDHTDYEEVSIDDLEDLDEDDLKQYMNT